MSREEGIRFLLHRIHRIPTGEEQGPSPVGIDPLEEEEAGQIWECMIGLPLALDQAAAYIEETRCTLNDYLEMFKTCRKDLLNRRGLASEHPDSVATTWLMALKNIEKGDHPAAAELLRLCAFLQPDAMPEAMICKGARKLTPVLQSLATEKAEWNETIAELHRYSLVKRKPWKKILTMHRLVQDVIRDEMNKETLRDWAERAVQVVNAAFPDPEPGSWPQCESLMPHALLAAQYIEEYQFIREETGDLLYRMASYLHARALYSEAESFYQKHYRSESNALASVTPMWPQCSTALPISTGIGANLYRQSSSISGRCISGSKHRGIST